MQVTFNVLLLWLTKRMSATWATIATVLCLDLTSLFSMSKVLMGPEAVPVTTEQYFGLIIAGVAMCRRALPKPRTTTLPPPTPPRSAHSPAHVSPGGSTRSSPSSTSTAGAWRARTPSSRARRPCAAARDAPARPAATHRRAVTK